jgi:hypothetical protein
MTDPHELDDLASAHLDGATTAEEAARVAADPALRARVEQLRAVREALAHVPPVDAGVRDQAIATALSALDEGDRPVAPVAPVTELASRRRGLSRRMVRAIGAAAVVLLVALLVPVLSRGHDQDDNETASPDTTGNEADADEGTASEAEELAPEAAAGGDAAGDLSARSTLGAFGDLDALATALATGELLDRAADPDTSFSGDSGPRCGPTPDGRTIVSYAVVAGAPVEVYLRADPDGTKVMTVFARGSCERLDEREL